MVGVDIVTRPPDFGPFLAHFWAKKCPKMPRVGRGVTRVFFSRRARATGVSETEV